MINKGLECDVCLNPEGVVKEFKTFQPTIQDYETHYVCAKCVNKLVEEYFSLVNVL